MKKPVSKTYVLSKGLDQFFADFYKAYALTARYFKEAFKPPFHFREIINQSFDIGLKSLSLITVTGFIIGVVFTKQSRPSLEDFGATS